MVALVPLATGNLSGMGIGTRTFMYDDVALPRLVIMLVLTCAGWAVWFWRASRDETPMATNPVWAVLVALAGWATLSAVLSPHRWFTVLGQSERLEGLVTIVFYALVYGLALQVMRGERALHRAMAAFAGASTILAVHGLLQFVGIDPVDYTTQNFAFSTKVAFSTVGNPNFLAALLVLALPCAIALAMAASQIWRVVWGVASGLILLSLVATLTRGAWAAAGVEAVLAAAVMWGQRRQVLPETRRRMLMVAVAVVFALIVLSATLLLRPDLKVGKLSSSSGAQSRIELTRVAVSAVVSRPVLGYGPDTFLAVFRQRPAMLTAEVGASNAGVNNVHDWPLQLAVTLGLPGGLLLLLAVVLGLGRSATSLSRHEARRDPLSAGAWIACLGFFLAMFLNVAMLSSTVPFWVLLGALGARRVRDHRVRHTSAVAGGVVAAVVAAAALAVSVALVAADVSYLGSRLAFNGLDRGDSVAAAAAAARLNPTSIKYARGLAQARAERATMSMKAHDASKSVYGEFALARSAFSRALAIDPEDYPSLAWLAALEAAAGNYLDDARLRGAAQGTAGSARRLDSVGRDVRALSVGDLSAAAQASALSVAPLP